MINRVKNKPRSNDKTVEKFSIRDVMRFVYMRQEHIGTSNFLENNDKDKRYKIHRHLNCYLIFRC